MLDVRCLSFAPTRRMFILSSMVLVTRGLPSMARTQIERLRFAGSRHAFNVLVFRAAGAKPRAAILVLGGSKGYTSESYGLLAAVLNGAGFDVFLVEYLTPDDGTAMERAGLASARVAFYATRLADWSETVSITMENLRRDPSPPTGFGVIGISLGAMPALSAGANGSGVAALAVVDGSLPDDELVRIRSLPPLLAVWGAADAVFPLSVEAKLVGLARRLGGMPTAVTYGEQNHAFFVDPKNVDAVRARTATAAFFSTHL